MIEYKFHGPPKGATRAPAPTVTFDAESHLHGAALALRHFTELGCDISAPLAHVDLTEADGARHTLLVDEVLDWLQNPNQAGFVARERLGDLLSRT